MPDESPKVADCYAAGEREAMEANQQWRARLLGPMLRLFHWLGVTADHITLISLVVGIAACPLLIWSPSWGLAALLAHVLLDGLDGPLARHAGTASPKGSLTDTMCDQTVVTGVTITLMALGLVSIPAGGCYIFVYTMVVVFAMIRNALQIPYSWLVRPRFVVYLWIAVEVYWWPGSLEFVLWGFNGLLALKLISGFWKLRQRMSD